MDDPRLTLERGRWLAPARAMHETTVSQLAVEILDHGDASRFRRARRTFVEYRGDSVRGGGVAVVRHGEHEVGVVDDLLYAARNNGHAPPKDVS